MQKGKLFARGRAQHTSPSLSIGLQGRQCQRMEEAFFGMGAPGPRSPHMAQTSSCSLCASPGRKVLQNLTQSLFGGQAGSHSC